MKKWQEKMLNSKNRIVVCNCNRGSGKTLSIFGRIISEGTGNFIYFNNNSFDRIKFLFKEHAEYEESLMKITITLNKIICEYKDGGIIEVSLYKPYNANIGGLKNIKMAFFDDCIPTENFLNNDSRQMLIKQIYIFITNKDLEFIDDEEVGIKSENDFINYNIAKLQYEFNNIEGENSIKKRNDILDMIIKLESMRKLYVK